MNLINASLVMMSFVAVAGCGEANASDVDPSNPVHCTIGLEIFKQAAELKQDARLVRILDVRAQRYAERAKLLPESERSEKMTNKVGKQIFELDDAGVALVDECIKRQDAEREQYRRG